MRFGEGGEVEVVEIDHGWNKIKAEIIKADKAYVKIGLMGDSKPYSRKKGKVKTDTSSLLSAAMKITKGQRLTPLTVPEVAIVNEFGTSDGHIPSRPFMKQAFEKNKSAIDRYITDRFVSVMALREKVSDSLKKIGLMHQRNVRDQIRNGQFKGNAASTIAAKTVRGKKGTSPLIDTGHMMKSVDFEVVEK
jgi:hypothetical protein